VIIVSSWNTSVNQHLIKKLLNLDLNLQTEVYCCQYGFCSHLPSVLNLLNKVLMFVSGIWPVQMTKSVIGSSPFIPELFKLYVWRHLVNSCVFSFICVTARVLASQAEAIVDR